MALLHGWILELTPPESVPYFTSYLHDVVKWRFKASKSGTDPGIFFCDGNLILRKAGADYAVRPSANSQATVSATESTVSSHGFDAHHPFRYQVVHPVRGTRDAQAAAQIQSEDLELLLSDLGPNSEYTAKLGIPGDPNEPDLKVQPDTGSSALWVLGDGFTVHDEPSDLQKSNMPRHIVFYPGRTANSHGSRSFNIKYLDNSFAAGPVYDDIWSFPTRGGSPLQARTVFGVAETVHLHLAMSSIDGVLGLGFSPPTTHFNPPQHETWLKTLRRKGLITELVCCVCFSRTGKSFLSVGCFPPEVPKPRHWIPVKPATPTWLIPCHAIGWGSSPEDTTFQPFNFPKPIDVLIDSGTTHCYFPDMALKFIHDNMGGREDGAFYQLPSRPPRDTRGQDIWVQFGDLGAWYVWPRDAFYGELAQGAGSLGDAWYHSRLHSQGDHFKHAILGAAFFEHFYVYFDADPNAPRLAFEHQRKPGHQ